jgi:hypothetical protein
VRYCIGHATLRRLSEPQQDDPSRLPRSSPAPGSRRLQSPPGSAGPEPCQPRPAHARGFRQPCGFYPKPRHDDGSAAASLTACHNCSCLVPSGRLQGGWLSPQSSVEWPATGGCDDVRGRGQPQPPTAHRPQRHPRTPAMPPPQMLSSYYLASSSFAELKRAGVPLPWWYTCSSLQYSAVGLVLLLYHQHNQRCGPSCLLEALSWLLVGLTSHYADVTHFGEPGWNVLLDVGCGVHMLRSDHCTSTCYQPPRVSARSVAAAHASSLPV